MHRNTIGTAGGYDRKKCRPSDEGRYYLFAGFRIESLFRVTEELGIVQQDVAVLVGGQEPGRGHVTLQMLRRQIFLQGL